MRILVTGGRNFSDREFLFATLDRLHAEKHIALIVHGDARGTAHLAGDWAESRGIPVLARPTIGRGMGGEPEWSAIGKCWPTPPISCLRFPEVLKPRT